MRRGQGRAVAVTQLLCDSNSVQLFPEPALPPPAHKGFVCDFDALRCSGALRILPAKPDRLLSHPCHVPVLVLVLGKQQLAAAAPEFHACLMVGWCSAGRWAASCLFPVPWEIWRSGARGLRENLQFPAQKRCENRPGPGQWLSRQNVSFL